jgi:exodeoxyribonuclease-3
MQFIHHCGMKLISWNINGLNAVAKKEPSLFEFIQSEQADIYCLQETKVSEEKVNKSLLDVPGYKQYYWNPSKAKKGHAGVITYVRDGIKPISSSKTIENEDIDQQGRIVTIELEDFYLVNIYYTNAGHGLVNLEAKMTFDDEILAYFERLRKEKPIVACGDFNVCHKEIDIHSPKTNRRSAGFTDEEREKFTELVDAGYIDTFREFEKGPGHYTWWSYRNRGARENNKGWRLDYFVISEELRPHIKESSILSDVMGSDHCPIRMVIKS